MLEAFDSLRELTFLSIVVRILLAICFGGLIGFEREKHNRAAGLRTYTLVCLGATLAILLSEYEYVMIHTAWKETFEAVGIGTDVSRFGAQVINGIGFLGAGSIIVTKRQEVKGLTTAAGLWACACVGLAIGAGFYELVILSFALIFGVFNVLPVLGEYAGRTSDHMNLYIEFTSLDQTTEIIGRIKESGARIFDIDVTPPSNNGTNRPSAVFFLETKRGVSHASIVGSVSRLESVLAIEEL